MKHLLYFFFMLAAIPAISQEIEWAPLTREVQINTSDSLIKARIMINPTDFKVVDEYHYYWHSKGQINKNMGGYTGDILHGTYLVLDSEKRMITQGQFNEGLKDGTWKRWFSNGNLRSIENWKDSRLNGEFKTYSAEGELLSIENYKNGIVVNKEDKTFKIFSSSNKETSDSIPEPTTNPELQQD